MAQITSLDYQNYIVFTVILDEEDEGEKEESTTKPSVVISTSFNVHGSTPSKVVETSKGL